MTVIIYLFTQYIMYINTSELCKTERFKTFRTTRKRALVLRNTCPGYITRQTIMEASVLLRRRFFKYINNKYKKYSARNSPKPTLMEAKHPNPQFQIRIVNLLNKIIQF